MENLYLVRARHRKRWTIDEASTKVTVSLVTYRRWERGSHVPTMSSLDLLCLAFQAEPDDLGYIIDEDSHIQLRAPEDEQKSVKSGFSGKETERLFQFTATHFAEIQDLAQKFQSEQETPPASSTPTHMESSVEALMQSVSLLVSHVRLLVQTWQNMTPLGIVTPSSSQNTSTQIVVPSSPFGSNVRGIMEPHANLEGGEDMDPKRRQTTHGIVLVGTSALTGHQDFIADIQRLLRQPSSGPGDKELKDLEQKIRGYWLDYYGVAIAPTDLMLHVAAYVQDVKLLLNRSLLPLIRTRLCACLSQGMLLTGVNCYALGQFQTARRYYQVALEAAHEANNNILQAEAWCWDSYSWMRGNEPSRYQQALNSMRKACGFASLGSDRTVQSHTLAGSAEIYGYLKDKAACIQALKDATGGYGRGDYHYIHQFDDTDLHWYRGISLQQFDQPGDPDSHTLLEEAGQAMQEVLSQLGAASLQRAFYMVDMAQLHARKGEVESACDRAGQIISVAGANASVRHKLLTVRTLLEPHADVAAVKDLDREMRVVLLAGQR